MLSGNGKKPANPSSPTFDFFGCHANGVVQQFGIHKVAVAFGLLSCVHHIDLKPHGVSGTEIAAVGVYVYCFIRLMMTGCRYCAEEKQAEQVQ